MKFFTDITTNISKYCVLHIKKYNDKRKYKKKIVFVDPGVTELFTLTEYSKIKYLHSMTNKLLDNEYISIDYPPSFNKPHGKEFMKKTLINNIKYKDNNQYICCPQFNHNIFSFLLQVRLTLPVMKKKKIIGFGVGRIKYPNEYTDYMMAWIKKNCKGKWVHFYGMGMRLIRQYVRELEDSGIEVSVDSTKWTKRIHNRPPLHEKVCCSSKNRDVYFLEYMKEIEKSGIKVEY